MSKLTSALCWIIAGSVLTVVLLEAILRMLPVSGKGVYGADLDPSWPIHHMIPHSGFTYSAGWNLSNVRVGSINNMGYVAPFDYEAGTPGVAVLGDSYVESLMNDYGETLQGRLGGYLREPATVMQFANSGGSMPDYLAVANLISGRFKPTWAVIVLSEGDFVEGFSPNSGYYSWDAGRDPPVRLTGLQERSALVKWARQQALVRYVRYNLKIKLSRLLHAEPVLPEHQAEQRCETVTLGERDVKLVRLFVKELPVSFGLEPSHIVLVFDSNRKALYGPTAQRQAACPTRDSTTQALLREQASAEGMHVLETGPLFTEYYERTGHRLDYSPVDWHWNADAHRLVARDVARIINSN